MVSIYQPPFIFTHGTTNGGRVQENVTRHPVSWGALPDLVPAQQVRRQDASQVGDESVRGGVEGARAIEQEEGGLTDHDGDDGGCRIAEELLLLAGGCGSARLQALSSAARSARPTEPAREGHSIASSAAALFPSW